MSTVTRITGKVIKTGITESDFEQSARVGVIEAGGQKYKFDTRDGGPRLHPGDEVEFVLVPRSIPRHIQEYADAKIGDESVLKPYQEGGRDFYWMCGEIAKTDHVWLQDDFRRFVQRVPRDRVRVDAVHRHYALKAGPDPDTSWGGRR